MKLHHGTLDIDSTEGVGTKVTIQLPVINENQGGDNDEQTEE